MELSIIITSYKQPEMLKILLDSIKKHLTLPKDEYEIIVADSMTEEDTEMMMREDYPETIFVGSSENIGFGGTVKNGYEKSHGEYILIMNGDVIVKEGAIEMLLDYIRKHPSVGIVGPKLLSFNESVQPSCFRFYTLSTIIYRRTFLGKLRIGNAQVDRFMMKDFDHKSTREVDWVQGSAMMTRRSSVEKIGLMDPRFKMYFEDVDWCRRFWENGLRVVYFPAADMYHYHGRGSAGKGVIKTLLSKKLAWIHIASALKYFWKYFGKPIPKY